MIEHQTRRWLAFIIAGYVLLGVAYVLATPPFEASDEYAHYPVVQYIQTEHKLPVLDPENPGRWRQEAGQPPLYYLLMAALTGWIDTSDLPQVHQFNDHAFIGNPNQVENKNLMLHQPEREAFPWRGAILAVYVIRFTSLLLGLGTVLLTMRLGFLLFNPQTGLLAAALTAFNPMFLFVHSAVNNDALGILLGHAGLYGLIYLWRDKPDPARQWFKYAAVGFVFGLGLLTKLSLGALLPLAGLALAWRARQEQDRRYLLVGGPTLLLVALALASPWFLHNLRVYGEPTGLDAFVAVLGTRDEPLTWSGWVGEFGTFYRSFWGLFGGVNIAAPELIYVLYNLTALLGVAGFGRWLWYRWRKQAEIPAGLWLLLAWPLLLFLSLLRWNITFPSFQGRLIFPGLGAMCVLGSVGLLYWMHGRQHRLVTLSLSAAAFLVAALLPWLTIRPAYAYPEPLAVVPDEAQFGPITFHAPDGNIQLVGMEMPPGQSTTQGDGPIEVTVYWRAVEPVTTDYLSAVHLLGRKGRSIAAVNRHPARGLIPTSRWEAGQIWRDVYHLYVQESAVAPARLQVRIGLYDPGAGRDLPMTGPDGQSLSQLTVGEARLAAASAQKVTPTVRHTVPLEQGIRFQGYELAPQQPAPGQTLHATLYWEATATPQDTYSVFVHVLDAAGAQLLVADGPPVAGDFPTRLWRDGDMIQDEHLVALPADFPPGRYRLAIGLYSPENNVRLQRQDGNGDTIFIPFTVGIP